MSFMDYVKQGWEVAKLETGAVKKLAEDKEAIGPAIGILAIGGVCAGIGSFSLSGMVFSPIMNIIGGFVFVALIHFVATTFFDGKGQFNSLAVPLFCAAVVTWATIIPFVGPFVIAPLTGLWLLVVAVVSTEVVYGIERGKAIAVVAIPFALFLIIGAIFAAVVGAGFLAATGVLRA